jgi:hypothetical protein
MDERHIELARKAVALLRSTLTGGDPPPFVSTNRPLDKTTQGAPYYRRHKDPS